MPHLAPLAWALAPIIFWTLLLTLSASIWWSASPSFPVCINKSKSSLFTNWSWAL